jgi:MFS family permease
MLPAVLIPLIVACALFMENLDSTVLATSLPAIAASFGESPVRLSFAITSYLFSLAVFIPISGWVADRYGARNVFRGAIVMFLTGSILCGLSGSLWEMVAARMLQGLGGAMMVPVGRLVLLRSVTKADMVGAMAWLTVPALIGPVIGPLLGGFITTYFHWRWIFWINVPIAILGLVLVTLFIPARNEPRPPAFDSAGFLLTAAGLVGLMFSFETIGRGIVPGWASAGPLTIGAAAPCSTSTTLRPSPIRCSIWGSCGHRPSVPRSSTDSSSASASAPCRSCCRSCCRPASACRHSPPASSPLPRPWER